ncbi:unnamed protein product, partial [marine sediment metagenome]
MKKDFLTLKDYSKEEIEYMLDLSGKIKKDKNSYSKVLEGKNIGMLFDKYSTRTRLSFEVGIKQLGGNSIYLDSKKLQISRGETYQDTAKIFSAYLDGIVIRTYRQEIVDIFAKYGTIPVINGLTDIYHPCQVLSDMLTLKEMELLNKDLKFIYVGDSNNVTNSLIIGFSKLGIDITIGCPQKYSPSEEIIEYARNQKEGSKLNLVHDPVKAVSDADVVYTDVWLSMGDEKNKQKLTDLKSFQVNYKLLKY